MSTGARPRVLTRELLSRLLLVSASMLFTLLLLEIVCRVFFPDRQLRYVTDREMLWFFRANQVGTLPRGDGFQYRDVHINSLGFRGPEPPSGGSERILLLGDSFTFGAGVADSETFAARLDAALDSSGNAWNAGQPGYGVYQMQAMLERVAPKLSPTVAVVVIWEGDFLRQPLVGDDLDRYFAQKRKSELLKSSVLITHMYRALERVLLRVGADQLVVRVGDRTDDAAGTVAEQHLRGLEADLPRLLQMHETASRAGRGLVIVFWPRDGFAAPLSVGESLSSVIASRLAAFASENGIHFVNVQPALAHVPREELLIPADWHPTALAHCLAAAHIAAELQQRGVAFAKRVSCTRRPD
jgi:hypothetical protein